MKKILLHSGLIIIEFILLFVLLLCCYCVPGLFFNIESIGYFSRIILGFVIIFFVFGGVLVMILSLVMMGINELLIFNKKLLRSMINNYKGG